MRKVKLTDLCTPKQWKTIPTTSLLNEGYPVYGANGIIGYYSEYNHEFPVIAITCRGATCGTINITKPNSYITGNAMCLDNIIGDVDLRYLYYCLLHVDFKDVISGSAQPQITRQGLEKLTISICPLSVQKDIVRVLDRIKTLIDLRKRELTLLDDLIKARFIEMFGDLADPACKWEKCKLIDACVNSDDIKCGPFGTQLGKDEYAMEGVAVWEIPQINSEFKTLPTHFVTQKKAEELDSYSIIPGDIAMSRKGNVGRCAVFPLGFENGIIHSDVLRIRLDKTKVLPEFMTRQLHYSGDIQHQIEMVSSGAIMAGINVTKLKHISVYLPPIGLQDKFVSFVSQIDKSKVVVPSKIKNAIFAIMLSVSFGQITSI